ncbi:MAG: isoprenylcysteine carboxylmethyltransferase family protein [archaeon]
MYKLLFIVVYVLIYYYLIYRLTRKHMDTTTETINMFKTDFYTSQYFVSFFILALFSLIYYIFYTNLFTFTVQDIVFSIVIIFSGLIEYNAIKNLAENYYPQIGPEKRLVTSGIYSLIRHPIYLSALVLGLGLYALLALNILMYTYPLLIISVVIKVEQEDKYLTKRFKAYNKYKTKSYKLIPYIY